MGHNPGRGPELKALAWLDDDLGGFRAEAEGQWLGLACGPAYDIIMGPMPKAKSVKATLAEATGWL